MSVPLRKLESGIQTAKTGLGNSGLLFNTTPSGTTYSPVRNVKPFIDDAHPFKVYVYNVGGVWYAKIIPGTINSLVPLIGSGSGSNHLMTSPEQSDVQLEFTNNQSWIYIKSGNNGYSWPDDNFNSSGYPRIPSGTLTNSLPPDDDNNGHFLIATVSRVNGNCIVSQYINKIIWSERHKFTEPNTAYYIYWSI